MERRQAFKFALLPNGEQQRRMRRIAGSCRFVYNKALALQKEMFELTQRSHTRFQLDKLLRLWKQETPWLSETPAHALQQTLVDLDRAYTNFFKKRADFPKFHKKGQRRVLSESRTRSAYRSTRITAASVSRRSAGWAIAIVAKFSVPSRMSPCLR